MRTKTKSNTQSSMIFFLLGQNRAPIQIPPFQIGGFGDLNYTHLIPPPPPPQNTMRPTPGGGGGGGGAAFFFFLLLQAAIGNSQTNVFYCSERYTYPRNGKYMSTLQSLLRELVQTAPATGFANATAGTAEPDIIYGLALCRGDFNASTCAACLTSLAVESVNQCPGSLSGAFWYDGCRLRFSDTRFFSTLTAGPQRPYLVLDKRSYPDARLFGDRFENLTRGLQRRAAFGSGAGMYAAGSAELGGERLFAMVQCTRDLSGESCARCLDEPISFISCCASSVEMAYQGGSCYLRYAFYLFFNASVVAPPLASEPPLAPPPGGSSPPSPAPAPPRSLNASAETWKLASASRAKKHNAAAIVAIALGLAILALLLLIAFISKKKKRTNRITLGKSNPNLQLREVDGLKFNRLKFTYSRKLSFTSPRSPKSGALSIQKLDLQALKISTDNFSENKRIGRGEFGAVYKGDIPSQEFVVKRFNSKSRVELAQLQKEFRTFSKLYQQNIVKLLAFHIENEGGEKLVVFEYLPNTSLDRILFDTAAGKPPAPSTFNKSHASAYKFTHRSRPPRYPDADNRRRVLLDWGRRFKIIQGVAQGLLYLHGEAGVSIIHQNLKASNILLDKQMEPKISDFCLPRLFVSSQTQEEKKKSSSASGYTAPECLSGGVPDAKSDVFSYGVLVLEIVTGQKNRDLLGSESSTNLLSYVWQYWQEEKALQVLDWSLGELYKGHEVLRCIHVGLLCVQEDPEKRPNMAAIVSMLNSYSFTLPSPCAPAGRPKNGSGGHNGNDNSKNWDWKMYNQNTTQVSPKSPSGNWADVKLESR